MSDLIRRGDVIKLVRNSLNDLEYSRENDSFVFKIEAIPPVTAMEVVRCRDCEHYMAWLDGKICGRMGSYYGDTKPDDYCSRGERREENG